MNVAKAIELARKKAEKAGAQRAVSLIDDIQMATEYAEPGYSTDKDVILFGNWNKIDRWNEAHHKCEPIEPDNTIWMKLVELLGKHCELQWEDEWTRCSECNNAIRTQPDSYSWTRSFVDLEEGILCCECARKSATDWLESDFENQPTKAVTDGLDLDLTSLGYNRVDEKFEHGLYGGQDADPKKIGEALRKQGITRFLFSLDSVGQFDANFSVWIHQDQWEKFKGLKAEDTKADIDPAIAFERGLSAASAQQAELRGEGVRYSKIQGDGTAVTRIVSAQEFIEGIKD